MTVKSPADWRPLQRVKNNLIYAVICGLLWLVRRLPASLVGAIGATLGFLGYYLDLPDRRRAIKNLNLAFGESYTPAEKRRIAKKSFIHIGRAAAEIITAPKKRRRDPNWVTLAPGAAECWQSARAPGRGVLAMTGHFGHWELLAQVAPELGGTLYAVAKKLYDPRLTALVESWRGQSGLTILWRERHHSLRPELTRLLKGGHIIGILNDQCMKVPGEYLPFFGHPAWTASGAADLAYETGAAVLGVSMLRRPGGGYEMAVTAIERPAESDKAAFVRELNRRINSFYEDIIRAHPGEWMWLHDRWLSE